MRAPVRVRCVRGSWAQGNVCASSPIAEKKVGASKCEKNCVVLSLLFFCFFFSITKKGALHFSHKHLGLSLFLPLLFGSLFKERQFSLSTRKTGSSWDMFLSPFFLGGLSLVVFFLVIMVPVVLFYSHSSTSSCRCLFFGLPFLLSYDF